MVRWEAGRRVSLCVGNGKTWLGRISSVEVRRAVAFLRGGEGISGLWNMCCEAEDGVTGGVGVDESSMQLYIRVSS